MTWQTKERPGYLGKDRDNKINEWNQSYGQNNWRLAWLYQNKSLNFLQTCGIYEEAYFIFLKNNRAVLRDLVTRASDVYDDSPTNIYSRFDYSVQETNRTHIQDIAIRHSVSNLGESFHGSNLIQIRDKLGDDPLSLTLSPGQVPFHRQNLITKPWLTGWWNPGSVECFYQSNRVLQSRG